MGFFSDLWDDIKDLGQSIVDVVKDAVEAVIDAHVMIVEWNLKALRDVRDAIDDGLQSLLGGGYAEYGDATSTPLFSDYDNGLSKVIVDSVLNDLNIADAIISHTLNGYRSKVERYWRYGVNKFPSGTPEARYGFTGVNESLFFNIILSQTGRDAAYLFKFHFDEANPRRHAEELLETQYGLDPETDVLHLANFTEADYDLTEFEDNWDYSYGKHGMEPTINGVPQLIAVTNSDRGNNYAVLHYGAGVSYSVPVSYGTTDLDPQERQGWATGTKEIELPGYYQNEYYYYASYFAGDFPDDNNRDRDTLVYDTERTYFRINASRTDIEQLRVNFIQPDADSFLPMVPLRNDTKDLTDPEIRDDEYYESSKELLNIIDMDIDALATAINENPEVDKIFNAFLVFAADLSENNVVTDKYYFELFKEAYSTQNYDFNDYEEWRTRYSGRPAPINFLEIKSEGYQNLIAYSYIQITTPPIDYTIPIGEYRKNITIRDRVTYGNRATREITGYVEQSSLQLIHRKSFNEFESVYVHGLFHLTKIAGNYFLGSDIDSLNSNLKQIRTGLDLVIDENSNKHNFLVPINMRLLRKHFSVMEQEELLKRALRLAYTTYFKREIKWYETEAFQIILIVAAIVITVLSLGTAGGTIAAAFAVGGAVAAAWAIVTLIVQALVIRFVVNEVAKHIDPRILAVLAVAAMMYGVVIQPGAVLVSGSIAGTPFAVDFLMTSVGGALADSATKGFARENLAIQEEIKEYEEKLDQLEEERKKDNTIELDPLDAIGYGSKDSNLIGQFMSTDQYYDVKIHSGNIGATSLDAISRFVDISLTLNKQLV